MPAEQATTYGHITEEGIAQLRRRMGKVFPIEEPFLRYVNADSIRHAARAIGDMNPLWVDKAHAAASRYGKLVSPPALLYGVCWGSWNMRRGEGLPGVHGLHAHDRWIYYRPLLEGDEVRATKELVGVDERRATMPGIDDADARIQVLQPARRTGGALFHGGAAHRAPCRQVGGQVFVHSEGEVLRRADRRHRRSDRGRGSTRQPPALLGGRDRRRAGAARRARPADLADIAWMQGVGSPHVRSGQYWLAYRRQSPKVAVKDPETGIPQAVERVHWDPFMAAEIGMPGPYDYGSQRGAWATHLATNWAGDDGWVAEVYAQYRGMNFIGDTVWIKGEVLKKWRGAKTGIGYAQISIQGVNQRGDTIMPGHATIALPSRAGPLPPLDRIAEPHGQVQGAVVGVGLVGAIGPEAEERLSIELPDQLRAEQLDVEALGGLQIVDGQGDVGETFDGRSGIGHARKVLLSRCESQ